MPDAALSRLLKVLVVDDEPDVEFLIRQKFRRRIRAGELQVVFASNGEDALQRLAEDDAIDVVLTDLNMPRMDGLTLLSRVADLDRLLKSVVVTAYGDMENIRTAMNRGAFDFLTKPIDLDDLEITIEKARSTVAEQRKAEMVRIAFGRYLSDEIVSMLLEEPEALKLGGEKRQITILMADIRGFSTISELHPPERVVEILNVYLGEMAEIITEYRGTIDEFIGDAILVFFGAPFAREDDTNRAVACALAMQQAMGVVNALLAKLDLPSTLEMGIGINTGEVVVGNIGSYKRTKYGAVGSHVNLTARIESYTVGGQVLISEHTRDALSAEVTLGKALQLSAKGFSDPISIYEVKGIGTPYDLTLTPLEDRPVQLDTPWPVRYTVLDGKHLTGEMAEGTLLGLSPVGAVLQADGEVAVMSDLHLHLLPLDGGSAPLGEVYAKVIAAHDEDATHKLRFTAVPGDMARLIEKMIQ